MKNIFFIILLPILLFITLLLIACKLFEKETKPDEISGCTDSTATNYNPEATIDDGSCDYCKEGSSFLLISTNGGAGWDMKCLKQKIGEVIDISVIDSNNIWVCTAGNRNIDRYGYILHTTDGGITWETQFIDSVGSWRMDYIEMFDLNNGIALADWSITEPMFLKTNDGGMLWESTTSEAIGVSGDAWRRVDFVDVNTGYFYESGINPQKLYKTIDSGVTWEETSFDGQAHVLRFYNEEIGIVAYGSKIYRTIDGGNTWAQTDSIESGWGLDIEFELLNPSKVWLLAGGLYFSSDTGLNWTYCMDNSSYGADALEISGPSLWVYSQRRYLKIVDTENCENVVEILLPEYSYGNLNLGYDFDVVGEIIVIPGRISE